MITTKAGMKPLPTGKSFRAIKRVLLTTSRDEGAWNPGHVALSLIFITWMYSPGETCQRPWSTGASWAIVKG